jgi:hypothetical protein
MEEEGETDTGVKSKSWKEINGGRAMTGRPINEGTARLQRAVFSASEAARTKHAKDHIEG